MKLNTLTLIVAMLLMTAGLAVAEGPVEATAAAEKAKFGFAKDYSWVIGELVHRNLEGGFWQIRFIPAGTPAAKANKHRGKFVLGNPAQLKGYKTGDIVKITGGVSPNQMSIWMAGTIYKLKTVQRVGAIAEKPAPPAKLTAAQLARLKKLLADLGSDDFKTRETAEAEIKKLGPAALPHVQPLTKSDDAEIAERAGRIVEHLEGLLPPKPSKVSVKLSLDKAKYKVGERIRIKIEFKNEDAKAVQLPGGGSSYPWASGAGYELTGPDGKQIKPFTTGIVEIRKRMIYRRPIVLAPSATQTLSTSAMLVKDAPKILKPMPIKRRKALAPPKAPTGIAYLAFPDGMHCFALPKAGKYTLKLRLVGCDPNAPAAKPAPGVIPQLRIQARKAGVQQVGVVIIQAGPGGNVAGNAKPLVGTVESNAVTFEVVE